MLRPMTKICLQSIKTIRLRGLENFVVIGKPKERPRHLVTYSTCITADIVSGILTRTLGGNDVRGRSVALTQLATVITKSINPLTSQGCKRRNYPLGQQSMDP